MYVCILFPKMIKTQFQETSGLGGGEKVTGNTKKPQHAGSIYLDEPPQSRWVQRTGDLCSFYRLKKKEDEMNSGKMNEFREI